MSSESVVMKKKNRAPHPTTKRSRPNGRAPYPDNDPEWEHLEERFSQINGDDMKRLADLLTR